MATTPRKRRPAKQTAAANKARSEAAKRAAATRKANREAKAGGVVFEDNTTVTENASGAAVIIDNGDKKSSDGPSDFEQRIDYVLLLRREGEPVDAEEFAAEIAEIDRRAAVIRETMRKEAREHPQVQAVIDGSKVQRQVAAKREAAMILTRANLPVPEDLEEYLPDYLRDKEPTPALRVVEPVPAIEQLHRPEVKDEIQENDPYARIKRLEEMVETLVERMAPASVAPDPRPVAHVEYHPEWQAEREAKVEDDVSNLITDDARLYTDEEIEVLVEGRILQNDQRREMDQARQATEKDPRPVQMARIVRNLCGAVVHLNLQAPDGEKKFRLNLRPLGERGDTMAVPFGFQQDPQFGANVGNLYEIITQTEARSLSYGPAGYQQREAPVHGPKGERLEFKGITKDVAQTRVVGQVTQEEGRNGRNQVKMTRASESLAQALQAEQAPAEESWTHQDQVDWAAQQRQAAQQAEEQQKASERPHGANPTYVNVAGADTGLHAGLNAASEIEGNADRFASEEVGPAKVERQLNEVQQRNIALVEQAARAEAAKIKALESKGVIPEGALNARVTIERVTR